MIWDFRFSMGEVLRQTDDELHVKSTVDVYMSPQHAKIFSRFLAEQVAAYEAAIGPIPGDKPTKE